jgi:radical SAM superfamily enzyme YgiQ (UPF0313 family)
MYEFELGPIRPPSEAYSILLRVTRNCPWNKCEFCPVYKGEKFSLRSVDEIKGDIDAMYNIAVKIHEKINGNGNGRNVDGEMIDEISRENSTDRSYIQQIIFWMNYGMKSLFLQDADSMVVKPDDMVEILNHVKSRFPSIERITCYSRSKSLAAKTPEQLKRIREAGLTRIHIGMESGCDTVLKLINKGVTAEEHINAGKKVVEAGFELSEYYMPGLGGAEHSEENSIETARVLNAINPHFIRIRTTTPVPGSGLFNMMERGEWTPLSEKGKVLELRNMLAALEGITSSVQSDHMMNLIEDSNGTLPGDREKILEPLDRFLGMNEDDQDSFIIARRTGNIRFFADYSQNSAYDNLRDKVKAEFGSVDKAVLALSGRFL